jgi:hypothetical protein
MRPRAHPASPRGRASASRCGSRRARRGGRRRRRGSTQRPRSGARRGAAGWPRAAFWRPRLRRGGGGGRGGRFCGAGWRQGRTMLGGPAVQQQQRQRLRRVHAACGGAGPPAGDAGVAAHPPSKPYALSLWFISHATTRSMIRPLRATESPRLTAGKGNLYDGTLVPVLSDRFGGAAPPRLLVCQPGAADCCVGDLAGRCRPAGGRSFTRPYVCNSAQATTQRAHQGISGVLKVRGQQGEGMRLEQVWPGGGCAGHHL